MPQSKTPQLRFKGFIGEWEEKKLLDNIEKIIDFRGRTPKKIGLDWSAEGYLALSALNVKNGYIDFNVEAHYGNQDLYDRWMAGNELHKNQVLFTTEAPMGNVAQIPDNKKYILSQRTIAFDVKSELITEDFLAVLLRTPLIYKKFLALSSGGTAKGVSQRSLSNVDVFITKEIIEQTKIGDYFQRLDALIEQKEKKYQKLKQLKTAMLSQMFPKEGEHTPKLRFKGFSGEWEEKKLDNLPIYISDGNYGEQYPTSNDFKSEGIPFLRANNIKNLKIDDSDTKYISIEQHSILTSGHLLTNDILITTRGDLGNLALIDNKHNGSNINAQICLLRVLEENKLNYLYLLYILDFKDSKKQYKALETGTALKQLPKGNLIKLQLKIPLIEEQTKIGNYFQKLDTLIDLHQKELEKLKNMKKALLAKMFV